MSYDELRVEVLNIGFGFVLLAGGLLLVLLPALYRSGKDPALITFGAGVSLYGAVTLAQLLSIRAVVPLPSAVWEYAVAFGLYFQPVFAFRFVELYWGAGRFRVFRRIWQIHLAFAVCAAGFDIWRRSAVICTTSFRPTPAASASCLPTSPATAFRRRSSPPW